MQLFPDVAVKKSNRFNASYRFNAIMLHSVVSRLSSLYGVYGCNVHCIIVV